MFSHLVISLVSYLVNVLCHFLLFHCSFFVLIFSSPFLLILLNLSSALFMNSFFFSFWKCSISCLLQIKLRGFLSHIQQLRVGYWGITSIKAQSMSSLGLPSPRSKDVTDEHQQPAEASGRSWVQSMFSRETASRSNSFSRVRKWASDGGNSGIPFVNIAYLDYYLLFSVNLLLYQHGLFVFGVQPQMRMRLLANKIYLLLGRKKFKPMFVYLGVIVVPLLLYIVWQGEKFGTWWVTVKMQAFLSVEVQTAL